MIDALQADDAAGAAALSFSFGWPHREADWRLFLRIGHGMAWREGGALCGTAMWFPLGEACCSVGLVQVAPGMQGRGIGRLLMAAVMDAAGPRAMMLHATPAGAPLYARLGFAPCGLVRQWHGEYRSEPSDGAQPALLPPSAAAVACMDEDATGLQRRTVLGAVMAASALAVCRTGYAACRSFGRGQLVGPVVAADEATAIGLVRALAGPGFLRLDLADGCDTLAGWLAAHGLACVDTTQAMVRGPWPVAGGTLRRMALVAQAVG